MRIGPLTLLKGSTLLAWHWPWSLTWRWALYVHWHRGTTLGWHKMRTHVGRGLMLSLNTPVIDIHFQSQPNMRRDTDLWRVNRDEAYRNYARALGRDSLTDEEKQAAILNAVIESGQTLLEKDV